MEPLQAGDLRQVGPYRLEQRLGGGGMGQVFLGYSPGGRPVAVKIVRPEFTSDPEYRARFAREVQAARMVGGFHTAPVVDADPCAEPPWMVTAYIAGPSLQAVVAGQGPLTVEAACALGAALAEGLAAIHRCGLVHRDLKPGNIIMAADGPRIIDFGIAQPSGATSLTAPGTLVGTYAFMSPEQMQALPATPESDVFSLGCVLALAGTGRAPFDGATVPALMHQILTADPDLDGLPPGPFREVVSACLAKDPRQRPSLPALMGILTGGTATVLAASGQVRVPGEPSDRDAAPVPAPVADPATPMTIPRVQAEQVHAERHENVTITQQANASPGSVVIQIAGNAKIGDDT